MTTHIQHAFDFPGFALTLPGLPSHDMLSVVEEEIKDLSNTPSDDPVCKYREVYYRKRLNRLLSFLQTFELPADIAPREQEAYQAITSSLETEGLQVRKQAHWSNHVPLGTWLIMATSV